MSASAGAAQWNANDDTTLRSALINAAHGDLLNFTSSITVVGSDLPAIVKNLTIIGNNHVLSGANQYRGLFAYSGSSLIAKLNIGQTLARGGSGGSGRNAGGGGAGLGGGLFVAAGASVSIVNVQFFSSTAVGGTGGSENLGIPGDGGGGGSFKAMAAFRFRPPTQDRRKVSPTPSQTSPARAARAPTQAAGPW